MASGTTQSELFGFFGAMTIVLSFNPCRNSNIASIYKQKTSGLSNYLYFIMIVVEVFQNDLYSHCMNPRFEQILQGYSQSAKDIAANRKKGDVSDEATKQRDARLHTAAHERALGEDRTPRNTYEEVVVEEYFKSHRRIYEIQNKKQKIMDWLHAQLQRLDDLEDSNEWLDSRTEQEQKERKLVRSTVYREGEFYCQEERHAVDIGTILTDGEWGIGYRFQVQAESRLLIKKYLVAEAKRKIQVLLDDQIIEEELTRAAVRNDQKGASAFETLNHRLKVEDLSGGAIAEKMTRALLSKMAISAGLDFEVLRADAYDDVRGKVDFIVRRKNYRRGVKVEANQSSKTTGIQFTINDTAENMLTKQYQLDRVRERKMAEHIVDDVVLVSIPLFQVTNLYLQWKEQGRPCGGPDALWDEETKWQVFDQVLRGVYSDREIDEQWQTYQIAIGGGSEQGGGEEREAA